MPETKIHRSLISHADRNERIYRVALQKWFNDTAKIIRRDLTEQFLKAKNSPAKITTNLTDWKYIQSQGQTTLMPATLEIMKSGGTLAYKHLALAGTFDVLNVPAVAAAQKFTAKLVKDVTVNTKKGIRTFIANGVKAGESMPAIARKLKPIVGLTQNQTQSIINYRKLLEGKQKYTQTQINNKVTAYTNKTHRRRMEMIARTETARAQNIGYVKGLEEVGIKEVQFQIAYGACEEFCVPMNGNVYSVSIGGDVIPVHPNCRCAMLPVINDMILTSPVKETPKALTK